MDLLDKLKTAVCDGDEIAAAAAAKAALESGIEAAVVLQEGAVAGVMEAGRRWQNGEFFLPEIILATEAYKEVLQLTQPLMSKEASTPRGCVLIGAVEGDAHHIGKDIVVAMLRCAGYRVVDLGVDVSAQRFVAGLREHHPDILGLGAYMTTTAAYMAEIIAAVSEAGLREQVRIVVGGAAVSNDHAKNIGSDGYADNAAQAVDVVNRLMEG